MWVQVYACTVCVHAGLLWCAWGPWVCLHVPRCTWSGMDARMCSGVLCMCVYVRAWTSTRSSVCVMCVYPWGGVCTPVYTQLCAPRMTDAFAPFHHSHPSPSHHPGVLSKVGGVDSGGADAVSKDSAGPPRPAELEELIHHKVSPPNPHPGRSEQRPASQDPSRPAPAPVRLERSLLRPSGPSSTARSSFPATRGVGRKGGTWLTEGLPECSPRILPRPELIQASRSES